MPVVPPTVLQQLQMYKTITYVLIAVVVGLIPLVAMGVKHLVKYKKLRKLAKEGYVKVEILHKNGTVSEHIVKPKDYVVTINKKDYLLPDSAAFKDQGVVLQDGGVIELTLDPSKCFIEPESGMKKWIFFEDDAIPIGTRDDEPLLNPKFLYHVILQEAQSEMTDISKYFKIILIALAGIAGLIFLLGGGAH